MSWCVNIIAQYPHNVTALFQYLKPFSWLFTAITWGSDYKTFLASSLCEFPVQSVLNGEDI